MRGHQVLTIGVLFFCSEYVKTFSHIYRYDCSRKNEFIKKGLGKYRSSSSKSRKSFQGLLLMHSTDLFRSNKRADMEKFPDDVCTAERKTGGDPEIITREEFLPESRPNIASIFGDQSAKGKRGRGKAKTSPPKEDAKREITHPRFIKKVSFGTSGPC